MVGILSLLMLAPPASRGAPGAIVCAECLNFALITSMSNPVPSRTDCGKLRSAEEWALPHSGHLCDAALDSLGALTLWFFVSTAPGCTFGFVMTCSSLALFGDRPSVTRSRFGVRPSFFDLRPSVPAPKRCSFGK